MISAVLIAVPLLVIGITCHVLAVLACHGGDKQDNDQETGR